MSKKHMDAEFAKKDIKATLLFILIFGILIKLRKLLQIRTFQKNKIVKKEGLQILLKFKKTKIYLN